MNDIATVGVGLAGVLVALGALLLVISGGKAEMRDGFCEHCGNPIRRAGTNEEWTHALTGLYRCPNGRPTVATAMKGKRK